MANKKETINLSEIKNKAKTSEEIVWLSWTVNRCIIMIDTGEVYKKYFIQCDRKSLDKEIDDFTTLTNRLNFPTIACILKEIQNYKGGE